MENIGDKKKNLYFFLIHSLCNECQIDVSHLNPTIPRGVVKWARKMVCWREPQLSQLFTFVCQNTI